MATVGSTTVQNILNTVVFPDFQKAFSNYSGIFGQIPMKAGKGRLMVPMHKTGMTADAHTGTGTDMEATNVGAFAEGEAIPTGQAQGRQTVEWSYKRYGTTVSIDGLTQAQSTAGGLVNLTDLLADEMMLAVDDLKHAITMDALGANAQSDTDHTIISLDKIVADDNTAICGLDQTSDTWFASYQNDNTGTGRALSLALMDDVWDNLVDARLAMPDAIWTSQKQFSAYEALIDGQIRYMDLAKGDARFKALDYRGVPVVAVPKFKNDQFIYAQSNDFSFYYLPQRSYTSAGKVVDGAFKVEAMDANGKDNIEFSIVCYVALLCKNPFKQGKLTDIS